MTADAEHRAEAPLVTAGRVPGFVARAAAPGGRLSRDRGAADSRLRPRQEEAVRTFPETRPEVVIHLAAQVGRNRSQPCNPGRFFYDNLVMGALMMEYARRHDVEKFVALGTVCCYPKHTPVPFREDDLWGGYPEETNAPYGLAKKMLLVQAQTYREQYGLNAIFLLPVNLTAPAIMRI
jgi:GDP-L-fucose synthase